MSHPRLRSAQPLGLTPENDILYARAPGPLKGNTSGGLAQAVQPGVPGSVQPLSLALIVRNAIRENVTGQKNWAAIKKEKEYVIVEAVTAPHNTPAEWKLIKWSGDAGKPVPGQPNQRQLSRGVSKKYHVEVALGGVKDFVDVWILWATVEIRSSGSVPKNAAPFQSLFGPASQVLGPVNSESMTGHVYPGDQYVLNMHARGKIVAIATLTPAGIHDVVASGWTFRRERLTRSWVDGQPGDQKTTDWTDDTSKPDFLRLTPDGADKIYDTDGPDIRWGDRSFEIYHSFRERVEWHSERCSDYGLWHFHAAWRANIKQSRQILFNRVGPGNPQLPGRPAP